MYWFLFSKFYHMFGYFLLAQVSKTFAEYLDDDFEEIVDRGNTN